MKNREIKYRAFPEFPKYEAGEDGSIYSLNYNHTGKRKELKQITNDEGYNYVFLVVNNIRYKRLSHRMIAITFIPNPENKPQVNHINGIRNDNRVENLEWCTARENAIHGFRVNGRKHSEKQKAIVKKMFSGESNPKAKLNEAMVLSIRRLRQKGLSLKEIAERHDISRSQVSVIANGKCWK